MAIIGNKLYRQTQSKKEQALEIDKQLARLEDDIRKLKVDFDIYFNGATKRAPLEARARLEAYIKRVADNRSLTYSQRYQFNTLVARFTSYRELWRRTLKAKGEELI
jgi:cation diffusion facilitator CzcD-associated flavoprotein CzcO